MKIAVWHNLPSGGGKRAFNHLLLGLSARGHSIESWCPSTADVSFLPLGESIPEHVLPFSWNESEVHGRLSYLTSSYRDMASKIAEMDRHCERCAQEINAGGFDVLFAHPCKFFRLTAIGRFVRIPALLYLQEPNRDLYEASPKLPWLALPPKSGRTWTPYAIKRSVKDLADTQALRLQAREERDNAAAYDRILVNSYFSRESVLRAYGLDSRVCYLGVEAQRFRSLGLPRQRMVVGLGAIHPSKGLKDAILGIAAIPEQQRPELIWIGNFADPVYGREIEALAKSLSVKFVPRVRISDDDVVDILNRAAVMIYTSRLEPFGFAPLEANACETPVVAIAEGGVRESIVDGINGTLVGERSPEAIGKALLRFLDDPALARKMGESARANVVDNWSWERSVECVEKSLEEVVKSGTASR